tara:strand:+ start:400 stop:582 length:183 start_codon:yes stop_codon:yes gene_type:complete
VEQAVPDLISTHQIKHIMMELPTEVVAVAELVDVVAEVLVAKEAVTAVQVLLSYDIDFSN